MNNDINNLPNLKEIESNLFSELQDVFQSTLLSILQEIDVWLRDSRDFERFENREMQKTTLATMFGPITINRRIYRDRDAGVRVALLDKYLGYDGGDSLSPFLKEMAVKWAIKGLNMRVARDSIISMLRFHVYHRNTVPTELLHTMSTCEVSVD